MKPLFFLSFLILPLISIAQIGAKTQQGKIQGIWQNNDFGYQMILMLNANGTGEFDGEQISYSTQANTLTITQQGMSNNYTFALQGNSLTLSGGDLDAPITFTRNGEGGGTQQAQVSQPVQPSQPANTSTAGATSAVPANLLGVWSGHGETLEFKNNGQCVYLGNTYQYNVSSGHIIVQTTQGNIMFGYAVQGNELSITGNGKTVKYTRGTAGVAKPVAKQGAATVAPELVGKWCYIKVSNSSTGGSMSNECFTLKEDGTYEYYFESSRSVNTSDMYAGTASQDSDTGTWSYDGVNLHYNSNSKGPGSYVLEKRNHPKTGDPMIVLNGYTYVTYFNKTPW